MSTEREFFIDNLMVRIHSIIVMMRWTGLAPKEVGSPFPGSLVSTFPEKGNRQGGQRPPISGTLTAQKPTEYVFPGYPGVTRSFPGTDQSKTPNSSSDVSHVA